MTEQQAQSPIDDLFRQTFENMPDTPAETGWDTPSDRVWQHVQANITTPQSGWSKTAIASAGAIAIVLIAIGLYWFSNRSPELKPAAPTVTPVTEQPVNTAPAVNQNTAPEQHPVLDSGSKPSTGSHSGKDNQAKSSPHNTPEEKPGKPADNVAQPLPGSKPTLPPNTTEAKKKQGIQ